MLYADVMELADVRDSKSRGSDTVWVRPPPSAPKKQNQKDIMSIWSATKEGLRDFRKPFFVLNCQRYMPVF